MELSHLYARGPQELLKAQEKLESNILEYIKAREYWTQCVYEYEKAYAEEIERLKGEDMPVTIAREIAKKNCLAKYKNMLDAETMKKKFQYFIEAGKEKINTYKKILSIDINNLSK